MTEQLNLMWRRDLLTADTGVGSGPPDRAPRTWLVVHELETGDTTMYDVGEHAPAWGGHPVFWARMHDTHR